MDHRMIIQNSLDYIEANLQTQITAPELEEQAGFSLFHYYRLFQQATGFPVMQYVLRRRLLHGVYAMKQGMRKIDAALRFGFDTYAGFYKAFCREFGCTPTEYLRFSRAKRPYRIDITKEKHMPVSHKKATQILHYWNLEGETIADIYDEGTGNKNEGAFSVGSAYVLKHTVDFDRMKKHIAVSKSLDSIGLMAPVPIPASDGAEYIQDGGCYFYLTRRLTGRTMVSHRFGDGDGRFVGEIIAQLHQALKSVEAGVGEADLLGTVRDWALPRSQAALNLSDGFCKEYLSAVSDLFPKLPRQIIHRDPNPGNIIRAEEKWGFLDFDLAERNLRIYDPCYAATAVLSETFGENHDRWLEIYRDIICGYDAVAHLTDLEREAIPYVILANQFVCVAWFAEQDKYAEIYETNRQMTHWLISNFEELCKI